MADAWRQTFETLVSRKQWDRAGAIDQIGLQEFSNQSWWQSADFQDFWQRWKQENARSSWEADAGSTGIWRLAEGKDPLRPSMGIRRQNDGRWWLIWLIPAKATPWPCTPNGCNIELLSPTGAKQILVKPEADNQDGVTRTLGIPVQALPAWQDREWNLQARFPGGQVWRFDLSYSLSACLSRLNNCQNFPTQAQTQAY